MARQDRIDADRFMDDLAERVAEPRSRHKRYARNLRIAFVTIAVAVMFFFGSGLEVGILLSLAMFGWDPESSIGQVLLYVYRWRHRR